MFVFYRIGVQISYVPLNTHLILNSLLLPIVVRQRRRLPKVSIHCLLYIPENPVLPKWLKLILLPESLNNLIDMLCGFVPPYRLSFVLLNNSPKYPMHWNIGGLCLVHTND